LLGESYISAKAGGELLLVEGYCKPEGYSFCFPMHVVCIRESAYSCALPN